MKTAEVHVSARISKAAYEKIIERQQQAKKQTGIEPKISAVVRAMIEEATTKKR